MAITIKHKDLLVNYVANNNNAVWARDLVCMSLSIGGNLTDEDKFLIWEEIDNNTTVPSQSLPGTLNSPYPKIEILKLTPLRYRGHSSRIEWDKLKTMINQGVDGDVRITELRRIYEKLSGRGSHLGALSSVATLSQSELINLYNALRVIV